MVVHSRIARCATTTARTRHQHGTISQRSFCYLFRAISNCSRSAPKPRRPSLLREDVLYMDNQLMMINKSAGVLSQGDRTGDLDVLELAREYVRVATSKPGEAFVAMVHRLDRPVSGALCIARTSKAAARLSASFRDSASVHKVYHAIIQGKVSGGCTLEDMIVHPEENVGPHRGPRATVVRRSTARSDNDQDFSGNVGEDRIGAKSAVLNWRAIDLSPSDAQSLRCKETGASRTLVRVRLVTGRKHQIRVQLAAMGHPIVGDVRYGWVPDGGSHRNTNAERSLGHVHTLYAKNSIFLHATALALPHPTRRGETVQVVASPPSRWSEVCGQEVVDAILADVRDSRADISQE